MTGATGATLGVRLLQQLQTRPGVETHLPIGRWARATIEWETSLTVREVSALADVSGGPDDQGAAISSGSFRTNATMIAARTDQHPRRRRTLLLPGSDTRQRPRAGHRRHRPPPLRAKPRRNVDLLR